MTTKKTDDKDESTEAPAKEAKEGERPPEQGDLVNEGNK